MTAASRRGASLAYAIEATALTCEGLIVEDAMTSTYPDELLSLTSAFAQSLIYGGLEFEPKAAAALRESIAHDRLTP